MISIRPAKLGDIEHVILRGMFKDVPTALCVCKQYWFASVESWVGCVDDEPACVWGLIAPSMMSEAAYLWLITCDLVDEHKFTFVRQSQMIIQRLLQDFPLIEGHAIVGEERARRWLKWLGVSFGDPIQGLDGKMLLLPFTLRSNSRGSC